MVYIFFIQGEGRGHLTQALTLKEKLLARGHKIGAIVVGTKNINDLPSFFQEAFSNIRLEIVHSPKFRKDRHNQGINIWLSLWPVIKRSPRYLQEIKKIKNLVADIKPDALINFYEPLAGLYWRHHKERPLFCLGHQYFFTHPSFPIKSLSFFQRIALRSYNYLSAPAGAIKIGLSFTNEQDRPAKNLYIAPPLIRTVIKKEVPQDKGFILSYVLNHGYFSEIIHWCQNNPGRRVCCFGDKKNLGDLSLPLNLEINYLSGKKFIEALANCSALAATAGFETIAEAAYLGKPILMVPTKNHFEQSGNAADAKRAKLAISNIYFNLSLLDKQKTPSFSGQVAFKEWVDNYSDKIIKIIER
ncbi:MAG: glycosyltransferase [Candidatus Falkowbacteria bacterium]|nr:glycosyltransferase [Candidatus Falkowbacteria bacterium]